MEQLELYRRTVMEYIDLCASGRQPSTFSAYCRDQGLSPKLTRQIIRKKFPDVVIPQERNRMGQQYSRIYEDFKNLCSEGRQPNSFAAYCRECGVAWKRMHYYMKDHGLRVVGLPGYTGYMGRRKSAVKCREVPFEDVIFEEAGFLPADSCNAITVRVEGNVSVSFPADTDVAVIAKFIRKMGKEAGHVGS